MYIFQTSVELEIFHLSQKLTKIWAFEFENFDLGHPVAKLGSNMQIFGLFCCQTAVFTYVSLFNNELV